MSPARMRVVVAGGGPAAIEALLALRELAGDRVELALVAPGSELVVRAYEVLAPFHEGREHRYPLDRIASDLAVRVVRDELAAVRPESRTVSLRSGAELSYDALIVAVGARHVDTIAGAIPFRGARDARHLRSLLTEARAGRHPSVAFVVPSGLTWPLPLYELAMTTSAWLAERGVDGVPLTVVTPERAPMALFGPHVSDEVSKLLDAHGVRFLSEHAVRVNDDRLLLSDGRELDAEVAVALMRLEGPTIPGLPSDDMGFVPVDEFGRVEGTERTFAAGDATTFPIKQGGLATQQADTIARLLAAEPDERQQPEPFRGVLRAVLFAGRETRYLHAELGDNLVQSSSVSSTAPWSTSGKLIGEYLAPYLDGLDSVRGASGAGIGIP